MQHRVLHTIARHAMFSTGQRVGVAVSGGADSVCLLHVLHELAPRWNLHLSVVHIDHGIRGAASQADADFVRSLAGEFALTFHFRQADVPSIDDNMEQAARRVRQEFYRELMQSGMVDRIATGHTRSDQAETVLFRILRGSGFAGLSGIRPVTREGIVRPLLDCTRAEVEAWMAERRIECREDESNEDRSFARNRIRHELLPQLRREFNPQLDEALANLAVIARDEEDWWHRLQPVPERGGVVILNAAHDLSHPQSRDAWCVAPSKRSKATSVRSISTTSRRFWKCPDPTTVMAGCNYRAWIFCGRLTGCGSLPPDTTTCAKGTLRFQWRRP